MSRQIVHIGFHKTGSSALQSWLAENAARMGYEYPQIMDQHDFNLIGALLFKKRPELYHGLLSLNLSLEMISAKKDYAKEVMDQRCSVAQGTKGLVISSEDLSYFDKQEVVNFQKYFKKYFEDCLIVAYVRGIRSTINSTVQQLIKDGLIFFDDINMHLGAVRKKIRPWVEVYGKERVLVRLYCPTGIVNDFVRVFDDPPEVLCKEELLNTGLSLPGLALVFKSWNFFYGTGYSIEYKIKIMKDVIKIASLIKGQEFSLSIELLSSIANKNLVDDAMWVEREYGIQLDDINYQCGTNCVGSEKQLINHCPDSVEHIYYSVPDIDKLISCESSFFIKKIVLS